MSASVIELRRDAGRAPDALLDVRLRETAPDELTVRLIGELDMATAELVTGVFRCRNSPKLVRLDLADLRFVDCAGLRAIETVRDRLAARAGRLELVHVAPRVHRLLQILGWNEAA